MQQTSPATDPVQSIRVASALAERFRALLGTGTVTTSEFELAIGEMQQLYPEIWRHLDEARHALAARGREVSEFDELRRGELAQLGVTGIEASQALDFRALALGGSPRVEVRTATLNVAGYNRAVAASRALMAAMPEIDWDALARAEDREIAAAGSLHRGKWLGTAKAIALVAALVGASAAVYRLATGAGATPALEEGPVRDPEAELQAARARADTRSARMAELYAAYRSTCDRSVVPELAQLLRDGAKPGEATRLETERCVPVHPSCDDVRAAITARLAMQLELARDDGWGMECKGIVVARAGTLVQGLAVVFTGRASDGTWRSMRGVVSPDGERDDVPFVPTGPASRLIGVVDLDGDSTDELVLVGEKTVVASRVQADGFTDVEGPVMSGRCTADVNIEGDFRAGRKGERKLVVLRVPDQVKAKGCMPPGAHYFGLVDGGFAEVD